MDINVDDLIGENHKSFFVGEDGLKHCSKCREPIECIMPLGGVERRLGIRCQCDREREEDEAKRQQAEAIERARSVCFADTKCRDWTFENDDGTRPMAITAARNYVEQFKEHKKNGQGIMFYGPVGTGKSFAAACIANAVVDKGYKVHMTNIPTIVRQMGQVGFGGREDYIRSLNKYALLVIDDLGVERDTPYMREHVSQIIDSRCMSGLPLIVTTNLTSEELQSPGNIKDKRVYDRVLEMCHPVMVDGGSRRRQNYRAKHQRMKNQLEKGTPHG